MAQGGAAAVASPSALDSGLEKVEDLAAQFVYERRRKMKKRLLLAATGAVAVAALVAASLALAGVCTLHLTAKDNHKSFAVHKHSVVVITLRSCGDCGYQWKRGPCSGVEYLSHRYVQHNKPHQVGGTGEEIFRFKVVGPKNEGEIQLRYVTPGRKIVSHFVAGLRIG